VDFNRGAIAGWAGGVCGGAAALAAVFATFSGLGWRIVVFVLAGIAGLALALLIWTGYRPASVLLRERWRKRQQQKDNARLVPTEASGQPALADHEPVFPDVGTSGNLPKPGEAGSQPPGSAPRGIWNIPTRNPAFTGRDRQLTEVHEQFLADERAAVQAFHGDGGVGKTQLAAEYAHRFAQSYDIAWWIDAEHADLSDQFAGLGTELRCLRPGADTRVVRATVLRELRQLSRWLLVFDNAVDPKSLASWLPGRGGHVLITSRTRNWVEVAKPMKITVLTRAESVALVKRRVPAILDADADAMANELGDLPLALAQAAEYMADTGMPARDYLGEVRTHAARILDLGIPSTYPRSLAAVTRLAVDRLRSDDPKAAKLAVLCAFLAPEPIPMDWFAKAAAVLPALIAPRAGYRQLLTRINRSTLGGIDENILQMHRLTQAILRDRLKPAVADASRADAGKLLAANNPGSADDFNTWQRWAPLVPHLLAVDPVSPVHDENLRDLACGVSWYLLRRGETDRGYKLSLELYEGWRDRLGANDPDTLRAATRLAVALRTMGHFEQARALSADTLERRRRLWGDNDPDTLISAGNLAADMRRLGKPGEALKLNKDILARRQRTLGDDHPNTLISATCVARDLAASGELQAARELNEDTLARRRSVLGDDNPGTWLSARQLASNLRMLGQAQAAADLDRDTETWRRHAANDIDPEQLRENEPEDVRRHR
jgi:tetratricopeptide repeat protein/NB-ARC domain-containing protein